MPGDRKYNAIEKSKKSVLFLHPWLSSVVYRGVCSYWLIYLPHLFSPPQPTSIAKRFRPSRTLSQWGMRKAASLNSMTEKKFTFRHSGESVWPQVIHTYCSGPTFHKENSISPSFFLSLLLSVRRGVQIQICTQGPKNQPHQSFHPLHVHSTRGDKALWVHLGLGQVYWTARKKLHRLNCLQWTCCASV